MKTTSQDSKQNQSNKVDQVDKVDQKAQQAESVKAVEQAQAMLVEQASTAPEEQLDLVLPITETLAMVSDQEIDEKKRKEKKENDDQDAEAKQQAESDKEQVAEQDQLVTSGGESDSEATEASDVAEALSEQGSESSGGELSIVTIALGTAGLFGAATYYKNTNSNDAPTFTSGSSAGNLTENSGANQVVYTAVATDDIDAEVAYSLSGADANSFTINSSTGEVRLKLNPDHEVKSQYSFAVVATDSAGMESSQPVSLQITDIDDAAPTITSASSGTIDENTGAGSVIYTVTADDSADISEGVTFSLSGTDASELNIDANTGEVTVNSAPDYEAKGSYSFDVIATDAAGNATAPKSVTISVNNLDEVAPTITSGATATSVDENIDAGQVVYTATATDVEDISAGVTFSLSGADAAAFSIDENTGAVALIASPDHESKSAYSFDVIATDAAGNASAPKTVTLAVNDLDEVAPTVSSLATAASVVENSATDQVIYTATADDSNDISGGITFSLAGADASLLTIDENTGEVSLKQAADHEAKSQYNFSVIATDAAGNESEPQAVNIDVTNIDESAPTITSANSGAIDENIDAGSVIYTVTADDSADISEGVTFSLSGTDASELNIDANTGAVTIKSAPDYEAKDSYSFDVIATDAAANESAPKSVTISVNNLDEVAPTITSGATATSVDENIDAGQVVYTATATDVEDISAGVTFSLSGADAAAFSIDENTGAVALIASPDHESKSAYSFDVIATDAAGNASAPKTVTLSVNDLDDSAPIVTSLATAASVEENSSIDQVIYTATADDSNDISDGFSFSLAGADADALNIDAESGEVTLKKVADHEVKSQYNFSVIATDVAGNASEPKAVTIDVADIDDAAPLITSDNTTAVNENIAGQAIYNISYDDSGDDLQDSVAYGFLDSAGNAVDSLITDSLDLSINSEGQITLNNALDFENRDTHSFIILVTNDQDFATKEDLDYRLGSVKQVTLTVNNLDDTAPEVISSATATAIDENGDDGQLVYTAIADDTADVSDGVKFSLAGVDAGAFSIDEDTGAVTLKVAADFESKPQYSFDVIATDLAGNASSAKTVTLDINDIDEAAPIITSDATATAIAENSGAGQLVYTASAADDSAVVYSLSGADAGAFSIDASTGEVTLVANPDFEVKSSYAFNIIATDIYGNASAPKAVSLDITNTDDTAPTISVDVTEASIAENSGAGQVVFTATADDSLDVSDGVSYSLSGADADLFSVNGAGQISLTGNPDYEAQKQYSLNVTAVDNAGQQSASQALTLNINNLDEQAPVITTPETAKVLQGAGADALVYRAFADDSADISGGITYSLSGADAAKLTINEDTGAVTLDEDPNTVPVTTVYSFSVTATDAAGNNSSKAVTLSITSQDLDAPEITSGETATSIDENIGANQVVYKVTSNDESVVTYSLSDNDEGAFSINENTGEVTLIDNPNAETKDEYSFTVVATDASNNVSAPKTVSLSINNLDEVAPTITSGDVANAIDENIAAGQLVYTATATDSADVTDGFTFSLSGADAALFSIDAVSGAVTLIDSPDHEVKSSYSFDVVATDAAGNSSAAKSVALSVNDLDDSAPTITSGDVATAIDSESGANQVVYTATADDSADVSDGVSFSLGGADQSAFSIDANSGEVRLTGNPNYEAKNTYSFEVVATDVAENNSAAQTVSLKIDELAPPQAILSLSAENDTGIIGDNISSARVISVSNLKEGATWEYSLDNGVNWSAPLASTVTEITLPDEADSTYEVKVRQTNASNDSQTDQPRTSESEMVEFTVDTIAPFVEVISADSAEQTITISYNEDLDPSSVPDAADYEITQSGNDLTVSKVEVDSQNLNNLLLTIDSGLNNGAVRVVYTPSDDLVQDAAGNQSTAGFNSMIVSDGYIRGADVYIDRDEDGIADADEFLPDYTTDEFGQLILPDSILNAPENVGKQIIIQGGINMDTGAANEIELKAPVGYEVINPLSTLVAEAVETGISQEEAEAKLTQAFNIELEEGEDLGSYDPLSDTSENALNNRVVVTQIATVLAVASAVDESTDDSTDVKEVALTNLTNIIVDVEEGDDAVEIDADKVEEILSIKDEDNNSQLAEGISTQILDRVQTAVEDMTKVLVDAEEAEDDGQDIVLDAEVEKVIKAQAIVIDDIAPKTPEISLTKESDLGVSDEDGLTSNSSPIVAIEFDTQANDGLAVVVGDILQIFKSGAAEDPYTLTQEDINNGVVYRPLSDLTSGDFFVSASISDRAGNSSFVTSLKVTVDIDEPVFNSGAEAAAIDENTSKDQVIYTPTSSSDDVWKFELVDSDDSAIYFDQETGSVKLGVSPDFEAKSQYSFTIKATDNAGNSSEQQVTLNVNNLDEVAPIITSGASAEIIENAGVGQVVYTATAEDAGDISGGVVFSLAGEDAELFTIDANSGQVTLIANPDYEAKSSYSFDVVATDTSNNASDPATVVLNILNADEQAPTITSGDSATVIDENSGAGQVIYTATATDDGDISEGVVFSLAGADADLFDIDANSGAVTLTANPDFEAQSAYSFDVVATDIAGNVSAPQAVTLTINNIDDTAPTITSVDTATSIDENTGAGQVIYTATADDSADVSQGVTFSLSGVDANLFNIDASSGVVSLIGNPDYEAKSSYSFEVIATDTAGNQSAPKAVSLSVNNVDDSAPTITSGDTATSLNENSGAGQQVYLATASDSGDITDGVTYSLAGDDAAAFSIDASSGAVTLIGNPDYETKSVYSFDVIATDAASNSSAPKNVTLSIGNIDDTAPTITSSETANSIVENSGAGQDIYTATADDSADVSAGVTFSLAGADADLLTIDASSGVVTLLGNPDFEDKEQYVFDVIATDAVGLVSQPQSVTLTIDNVIDSKPIWKSSTQAAAIDENSGSDQVVYTANAEVDLEGDNQSTDGITIAYSLSDNSSGAFEIDSVSGAVTLKDDPNYELVSNYSFSVIATDSLGNISAPIIVNLDINNIDDASPTITSGETAQIEEGSGAGQIIYTVTAEDDAGDIQAAGDITYSISGTDAGAFTINSQSGEISLTANPDFEDQNQYSFDVVANDAAGNASSPKTVTLSVANIDDTAPEVTSSDTAATVVENSGANQVVYTATATDNADDGDLSYSININVGNVGNGGYELEEDAPNLQAETQHIYVSKSELSQDGTEITVTFSYLADEANLSGVGFTANFDSAVLSVSDISNVFTGAIASGDQSADSSNSDSDLSTDQVLSFGWASLFGQFPGSTSADLATVTFDIVGASTSSSTLNFVGTSSQAGYAFDAPSYELDIAQPDMLSIDSQSGEVTLISNPDYEVVPQYSFDITATDASGNVSAPKTVTLNVENIDDTAPQFESPALWGIAPGIGADQVVYMAEANDGDDPGALVYDIDVDNVVYYSEGVIEQSFVVEDDGSITMRLILDEAIATDESNVLDNFDISIGYSEEEIGEIDNNQITYNLNPTFGYGNSPEQGQYLLNNVYFPVPADLSEQRTLLELNYTHESGVVSSKFDIYDVFINVEDYSGSPSSARLMLDTGLTIDSATGEVTLDSNPDVNAQPEYSFTVTATDAVGNVATQEVTLLVSDDIVTLAPDNDYSTGEVIYNASNNGLGDGINAITYSLYGGENPTFNIDSNTGEVRFNDDVDYQENTAYSFAVIATDSATNISHTTLVILSDDESGSIITPEQMITSPDMDIVLEGGGSDQVVYVATSNIVGATYSLVDHTVYPAAGDNSNEEQEQPQVPAETVITVPEVQANTQHVYVSDSQMSEDGSQVTVTFSYLADSASLSGVGMTVNFDSTVLSVNNVSDVLSGAIASGAQSEDANDTDTDSATDQVLSFGWASLFGGWPGSTNTDLATVTFDIADGATGSTGLNLVRTSSQAGYAFDGQSQDLVISSNSDSGNSNSGSGSGSANNQAPVESVVTVPEVQANTQHVYVSDSQMSEDGSQVTVTFSYLADSASLSGVGMTVNFDSTVLSVNNVSDVLSGAIASGAQSEDANDTDTDSATDQVLSFGWASLFGGWPGSTNTDLATVTFDIADGATGSTGLNLVRTSSQAGYAFDGQSHDVVITADPVDDNSGSIDDGSGSGSEVTGSQLSIDSVTGEVTLAGEADYQTVPNYHFTVTADNATESASLDVGLLVADYLVSSEQSSYQGTSDADVFALASGSAQVNSGDGADIFI